MTRWVAEIYDTSYDFEATDGFGDNINKQQTMKNSEINTNKEVRELNYLKGLHQNLS